MEMCWKENPESRPDFQNLCEILGEILSCEKMTEVRHILIVNIYLFSVEPRGLGRLQLSLSQSGKFEVLFGLIVHFRN